MHLVDDKRKRQLLKLLAMTALADLATGCGGGGSGTTDSGASSTLAAPTITTQPTSQSVAVAASAIFSVIATGTPAPTYQWQSSRDGGTTYTPIAGATSATYTTPATSAGDTDTRFRVVVSNSQGTVTSTAATLTVASVAPAGALSVFAGNVYGPGADGSGAAASFYYPTGPSVDSAGNLYIADSGNYTIRKITPAGQVTTLAGTYLQEGNNDGTGPNAGFYAPAGSAVDSVGNVYVSDSGNNLIRKITPAGVVTTLAGSGVRGYADGPGSGAAFFGPNALVVDGTGTLYVTDPGNSVIRKITPAGVVSTFAGAGGQRGSADGVGTAARFNNVQALTIAADGTLYAGDYVNHTIRKITADGTVTTLAGTPGTQGGDNGPAASATFAYPIALAIDPSGVLYVADGFTTRIRKITPAGIVSTVIDTSAGTAPAGFTANGLATDSAGNLYITNGQNDVVLKMTPGGAITTIAGSPGANGGRFNGTGAGARFFYPTGIGADASGNLYVADSANDTVRKVTPSAAVTTLAGAPPTGNVLYAINSVLAQLGRVALTGFSSGTGSADGAGTAAAFSYPLGLVSDASGTVYVADANNATIRQISPSGSVTTLAGLAGASGSVDGTGATARFGAPAGIAIDNAGTLYVTDYNDRIVRKIAAGGIVTTLAGSRGVLGNADGQGAAASFSYLGGIGVDSRGNIFVVDTGNATVRKITPGGLVSTFAGAAGLTGSADGAGAAARFDAPTGLAIDAADNIYVADTHNHTVRRITPAGVVSTVVGVAGQGLVLTGALPGGLRDPCGLVFSGGALYITMMNGVAKVVGLG